MQAAQLRIIAEAAFLRQCEERPELRRAGECAQWRRAYMDHLAAFTERYGER